MVLWDLQFIAFCFLHFTQRLNSFGIRLVHTEDEEESFRKYNLQTIVKFLPFHRLTWNNLQNSVLLHVGRKVPRSHVLFHYSHVGQFLGKKSNKFKCYMQMLTVPLIKKSVEIKHTSLLNKMLLFLSTLDIPASYTIFFPLYIAIMPLLWPKWCFCIWVWIWDCFFFFFGDKGRQVKVMCQYFTRI